MFLHLCGRADLWRRFDHNQAHRCAIRDWDFPRSSRYLGLFFLGRNASGNLDAGGAIHHPDRGLFDSGGVALGQADLGAHTAGHLRLSAREGDRKRESAA